jgi:thiol-disulfide isomerase/thioredoxin
MKRILLSVFALIFSLLTYSQILIENPKFGMSTATNVILEKIELRDTTTILWITVHSGAGSSILVPGETYIQPVGEKEKLMVTSAEGIALNNWTVLPALGEISYKLFFPKIDQSVSKLDYGEGNEGGSWFIYDIQLKPELFKSIVPEGITGNWFRSDNALWEISLFDSVAIYKSQVWKYLKYAEKDGLGKINLKCGSKNLEIYAKAGDDSTCLIGETPTKLTQYSKRPNPSVIPEDQESFKLPVFKIDTVTYCGYIKDFSPRYPNHTLMLYVNNVLTGEQEPYSAEIANDGTFQVKFLYSNPQLILVRNQFYNETVLLEPGRNTFQMFDLGSKPNPVLFMGDCARINMDLIKLKNINSYDYHKLQEQIPAFSPEQYSSSCQEKLQKDLKTLTDFVKNHPISAKAIQLKEQELKYRYYSSIFDYGSNVDTSFYGFLTNELVNNRLAILCSEYSFFINRIKYLKLLGGVTRSLSTMEIIEELEKAGYQLTPEEKELKARMKALDSPELRKVQEEFQAKHGKETDEFYRKYTPQIKVLMKEKGGSEITPAMIVEYLSAQKVELSVAEMKLIPVLEEYYENPLIKEFILGQKKVGAAGSQFHNDHREFVNSLFQEETISQRNEKFQKVLGIQPGFAMDVMMSQDFCRSIVAEITPVPDAKLKAMQDKISDQFIASYIGLKNNEAKAKVEANKKLKGAVVNEVPKTAADKVFDAIIEKYKGKVVYVDFWATWCSPCRAGIERIKPLKDEIASENVAFVYITNQTSPKTTYDNMIPSIKGEHYRVSADEWNVLSSKFKISGIPHYVLVGKDGKVINPELGHLENEQLKKLLMKYIKE